MSMFSSGVVARVSVVSMVNEDWRMVRREASYACVLPVVSREHSGCAFIRRCRSCLGMSIRGHARNVNLRSR